MPVFYCPCIDAALYFSIRPLYVFEKTVAFLGTFALLYTVTESFILPLTPTPEQSFFRSLLDLALPFMIAYILLFYIIFGKPQRVDLFCGSLIVRFHCRMYM
jgi:hypothetical protein